MSALKSWIIFKSFQINERIGLISMKNRAFVEGYPKDIFEEFQFLQ